METTENLTFQEIEQLCYAYMDCQLSKQQEKELELVLLCSDLTSPIIAEVRALMGVSTLMAITNTQTKVIKKAKPQIFKYSGIAACIATLVLCSVYFFRSTNSTEITGDVYVCVDGKVLTGHTAQIVVDATEQQTMNMFQSIIEDVEYEKRLSEQYINSIIE